MSSGGDLSAGPGVADGLSRWQDLVRFVALDIRVAGGGSTFAGEVTEPSSVGPNWTQDGAGAGLLRTTGK